MPESSCLRLRRHDLGVELAEALAVDERQMSQVAEVLGGGEYVNLELHRPARLEDPFRARQFRKGRNIGGRLDPGTSRHARTQAESDRHAPAPSPASASLAPGTGFRRSRRPAASTNRDRGKRRRRREPPRRRGSPPVWACVIEHPDLTRGDPEQHQAAGRAARTHCGLGSKSTGARANQHRSSAELTRSGPPPGPSFPFRCSGHLAGKHIIILLNLTETHNLGGSALP